MRGRVDDRTRERRAVAQVKVHVIGARDLELVHDARVPRAQTTWDKGCMIVFAHGLESKPRGSKVLAMEAAMLEVTAPDFRGEDLATRVDKLAMAVVEAGPEVVLTGSSYGGLAAAIVARQHPVKGLLLLAPALLRDEVPHTLGSLAAPEGVPTVIVHGIKDDICDIGASRDYRDRSPGCTLVEVDDAHRLLNSLPRIVLELRGLVAR